MVRLVPENSDMKPLVIRAEDVRIVGKVAGILRRL
jgi:SOS-response transcriptional repressor LexA